ARTGFVVDDRQAVAGIRGPGEAEHFDRRGRSCGLDRFPGIGNKRADTAPFGAGHDDIAGMQGAALNENGCHWPSATVELGFDDSAFCRPVRIGLEIQNFRLQADHFEELVDIRFLDGGHFHVHHLAAQDSTWISCCRRSVRTRSGLASGLSILLMATMIGTFAALAWWIASTVCGITPSSAATTST